MATTIERVRLTSGQRLGRGLKNTLVGPLDVTRGSLGLGAGGVRSAVATGRRRYRKSRVARELAAAQGAVAALPQAFTSAPRRRNRRVVWWLGGAVVVVGGGVAFALARRSSRPEPSPRPPSVDVDARP